MLLISLRPVRKMHLAMYRFPFVKHDLLFPSQCTLSRQAAAYFALLFINEQWYLRTVFATGTRIIHLNERLFQI